jgi:hypothetical protein
VRDHDAGEPERDGERRDAEDDGDEDPAIFRFGGLLEALDRGGVVLLVEDLVRERGLGEAARKS